MKTPPIGRTIASVVAAALVVVGVYSLVEARRFRKEFDRQSGTRPFDFSVDLSQPGVYTREFEQTWRSSHFQVIELHIPTDAVTGVPPSELLGALDGQWRITDSDGAVVVDDEFSASSTWQDGPGQQVTHVASFRPFDIGTYTFELTVVTGAPKLVGVEQRVVCQYQPCGLELAPALLARIVGIAALVIAGILLLAVTAVTKRRRAQQGAAAGRGQPPR